MGKSLQQQLDETRRKLQAATEPGRQKRAAQLARLRAAEASLRTPEVEKQVAKELGILRKMQQRGAPMHVQRMVLNSIGQKLDDAAGGAAAARRTGSLERARLLR